MTTENNTIKLIVELTAEEWGMLRKAVFAQSRKDEEDAMHYRKRLARLTKDTYEANYAKIYAERYLVMKEAKEKIDDAFYDQLENYWHNVENKGDESMKDKLNISDEG